MQTRAVVALFMAAFLTGCVSTKLYHQASPELAPDGYRRAAILAGYADLEYRQEMEKAFAHRLYVHGIGMRSWNEVVTPGLTPEATLQALREAAIDLVVFIEPGEHLRSAAWIPLPTYSTTSVSQAGPVATANTVTSGGGVNSSRSELDAKASLLDVRTGHVVWTATLKGDDQGWGYDEAAILQEMAKKLADGLREQGILTR